MPSCTGSPTSLAAALPKETVWPRRRQERLLCALIAVLFFFFLCATWFDSSTASPARTAGRAAASSGLTEVACGAHAVAGAHQSGFSETPVESTVLMLYSPGGGGGGRFCYSDATGEAGTVEQEFLRVAASYVSSPHAGPTGAYHDFFAAHDATLWTLDGATRVATPMRLDVVYTFVNPNAASFQRNMEARRVPFEQRRYRDWEELRYSLRSLREFVLANAALAQYHRRHAADVRRLGELGYTVGAEAGDVDGVVSLVRRVYLVLSNKDQVPAWLDVEKFPELRVVTHAEMFSEAEAAWVLPTLNSNAIESGLHRIPGISRFFLYLNNDMIVGRRLSFFDLFRPLSPPRQTLEWAERQKEPRQFDATAGATPAPPNADAAKPRVALFFETIFHSDGYVPLPPRSTLGRLGARLVPQLVCARLADEKPTGRWLDRTLRSLCAPTRFVKPELNSGNVLNHLARYHMQEELPGIVPSMEYAHMPHTIDREVLRALLDDGVDGFGAEVQEMRRAYLRSMNNFSPAHLYESAALAMRRVRTAALWCQTDERCAASVRPMLPRVARKWRQHRNVSCPGHPLEGDSQTVRLQHGDLIARWKAYEEQWLRKLTTEAPDALHSGGAVRGVSAQSAAPSATTGATATSAKPSWRYTPSQAIRSLLSERTARSPHRVSFQMISGCDYGGLVDASRVQSLVLDVHHHVSNSDMTFRFYIVEDLQRLAIVLSRMEHFQGAGVGRNSTSHLPLFITLNDDLESGVAEKQLRSSRLVGWNESHLTQTAFQRLLWLCSSASPPAPWER
ncbi:hypothetical protein NESM_000768500 [Novymonas esmeraldas]|uniref:Uncharacterized protein n=1 Tax=Novymonas esmeraldas TaxID=1808958 RepID=A0AAW0EX46_9TRYP